MSILKDFGLILLVSAIVAAIFGTGLFFAERSAYKRGKADAETICASAQTAAFASQLEEIERINSSILEAVEEGQREAHAADRTVLAATATLSSAFKDLAREPVIPVLPDCRRSYDAVRLYQRAASGAAAGYREVETSAGLSGLGDAPMPRTGDASGN